jgi:hypothetical protein
MRQSAFAATNLAIPPQGSPAPEGPWHHGLPVPARSRPHSTGATPLRVNTNVRGATIGRSPGPTQTTLDDFVHIRRFPTDLRETRGGPIKSPRHAGRRRTALEQKKSSCDNEGLANPLYHGEEQGYFPLTEQLVHNCWYTDLHTTDVLHSLNDIMLLHRDVYTH